MACHPKPLGAKDGGGKAVLIRTREWPKSPESLVRERVTGSVSVTTQIDGKRVGSDLGK
jgi:hypothetical protein